MSEYLSSQNLHFLITCGERLVTYLAAKISWIDEWRKWHVLVAWDTLRCSTTWSKPKQSTALGIVSISGQTNFISFEVKASWCLSNASSDNLPIWLTILQYAWIWIVKYAQKFAQNSSRNFQKISVYYASQCSYCACIMLLSCQQFLALSWNFEVMTALLEYFTTRKKFLLAILL